MNCPYCSASTDGIFMFPDGKAESVGKWCSHPTDDAEVDR